MGLDNISVVFFGVGICILFSWW